MTAAELQRRLAAGAELVAALRAVEDRGSNLVGELLGGAEFVAFEHRPAGDVFDPSSGAHYYFHAHGPDEHRQGGMDWAEIGHIHTFFRPMGRGDDAPIHHLIAIALDRFGRPAGLFTTNRWVTGEDFVAAPQARAFARRYSLADPAPVNRLVTAIFTLFSAEIDELLDARDAAIATWERDHPERDVFEDRALEITSSRAINFLAVLADLQANADD